MSAVIWLASYPKSGNTWVRLLLANYLSGEHEPIDINEIASSSRIASSRRAFDEWCGVEASSLEPAVVDRLRAHVYRRMAADSATGVFIKVHDAWGADEQGQPMFPAEITAAAVYVVRNPLDVAVSSAHHWGLDRERAVERMCDVGYCFAGTDSRLPDQLRQFLGCWSGHARSWLDRSGLDVHLVRYEDLRRDAEASLTAILGACGIAAEPERVRRAVQFSGFEELQRQEQAHGFRERPPGATGAFFRRGAVGAWRDELPGPLAEQLVRAHGEMMARFGYLEEVT